ncbi:MULTISPECIES: rhomboid family intramembrane serine protease [Thermomonospora]|uniref:Rhomboid family protein n=1 Tax=Thermomonospora curvata (strain ATCC 19995 / DSM 43183 / JCM 3096 / KCTC 9072 / NBRC 15933 / NCIMB 10081 / Henssen B9) TaxID=471852 RepID=D1A8X1_THECD|nr:MULTISPECIES: rhomboid family intramembrane serine protease [Thermomonospora]ACY98609.1 Rhomboid family protein [Thermomonospora curvata DSM 43183]PKK13739.1 MAG: rhomboid family intramembrane serine protease [Thermomonospora sp. CIF 1]
MAVPLYDSQPARRAPVVTYLLVAVNIVVFLFTPMANFAASYGEGRVRECNAVEFTLEHGAIPKELVSGEQQPPPERVGPCPVEPYEKVPWVSAFTSMFLHADWLHLMGNVVMLFVLGAGVEDRFGRARYLLAYLLFGLAAVYGYAFTTPSSTTPLIGASGAIAGVLGAYLILNPRGRIVSYVPPVIISRLPAWVLLGLWFVLQWLSLGDESSNVAYVAHIYGFVAGMLFALMARRAGPTRRAVALARE